MPTAAKPSAARAHIPSGCSSATAMAPQASATTKMVSKAAPSSGTTVRLMRSTMVRKHSAMATVATAHEATSLCSAGCSSQPSSASRAASVRPATGTFSFQPQMASSARMRRVQRSGSQWRSSTAAIVSTTTPASAPTAPAPPPSPSIVVTTACMAKAAKVAGANQIQKCCSKREADTPSSTTGPQKAANMKNDTA